MDNLTDIKGLSESLAWMLDAGVLHAYLPVKGEIVKFKKRSSKRGKNILMLDIEDGAMVLSGAVFDAELVSRYEGLVLESQVGDVIYVGGLLRFEGDYRCKWCSQMNPEGYEAGDLSDVHEGAVMPFMDIKYMMLARTLQKPSI